MKLGHQYLLLSLAVCSLGGCIVVARPPVRASTDVIVYSVHSTPPPRPVGWRRSFQFYYYPSCQVYYAPHRNCYIWKGPRGWMTTPKPPPNVLLDQADALNVELENDDPVAFHAQVEARARPMGPKARRPQRGGDVAPRHSDNAPDQVEVEVEVNATVEDQDTSVEIKSEVPHGRNDRDGDRGEGMGANGADDREGNSSYGKAKGKAMGKGKANGKDKDKDKSDG